MAPTGLAVGLNKGHITTKRDKVARPANRKGVSCWRVVPAARHHATTAAALCSMAAKPHLWRLCSEAGSVHFCSIASAVM